MNRKQKWLTPAAAMLTAVLLLSGCSSLGMLFGKTEKMDFSAPLELKAPEPAAGEMPKILFVGNSHTFSNDLPGVFYQMAYALNREADVYDLTEGYYTLEDFANPEDELGAVLDQALSEEAWDFVILQENTSRAVSTTPEEDMFPYARALDEKIKNAGGQTAFLMTWSPKNGVESDALKLDRDTVQTMLAANYLSISKELDDLLIPAGVAFMRCSQEYSEIELWDEDEQHPSPEGTYLTACVAYAMLFQQSPEGCTFTAELETDTAQTLQTLAAELVLDK